MGDNSDMSVGTKLDAALRSLGWDQRELAVRSGVSEATISKIINDRATEIPIQSALAISRAVGLDPEWLWGPRGGSPETMRDKTAQIDYAELRTIPLGFVFDAALAAWRAQKQ